MIATIALVCLASTIPIPALRPAPAAKPDENEVKVWATAKLGRDTWKIKSFNYGNPGLDNTLFVCRNGRIVKRTCSGCLLGGEFLKWPFYAPLVVLSSHSQAGHGLTSWFYVIRNRRLVGPLLRIEHEVGGPIFKDLDGDGRPEMIFDNYDWYTFYHKPPTKLRVYKVSKDYKIRFWKELPNRSGKPLKFLLPYF